MTNSEVIAEVKYDVSGAGFLELELEDSMIELAIQKALRKLNRYWDETTIIEVPFCSCIDTTDFDSSSIVKIYRVNGYGSGDSANTLSDPMYAQQWMLFSNGGTMYNLNDYILNFASWNTLLQIKNTMSTDLAFKEDKHNNKLYINQAMDKPASIAIEFIPKLHSAEDIKSDYWTDILIKLTTAITKIALGRIRTRYTQSNALFTQDGERMLEEGNTELKELEEILRQNSNLLYGID